MIQAATAHRYDHIGQRYAAFRQQDVRIAAQVRQAIGDADTLLNVGAGTGNYEPHDVDVVAVEPSTVMIAQRPAASAPVVRGVAESLPFAAGEFDVALAVLTVHHWVDLAAGLREMRRVASTQVVLLFDRSQVPPFWLHEYFPQPDALSTKRPPPGVTDLARHWPSRRFSQSPYPVTAPTGSERRTGQDHTPISIQRCSQGCRGWP